MLATPGLPAGSCAAPPTKANDMAMSGTVSSSTSQASMPFGLTTRWMLLRLGAPSEAATRKNERGQR